jgi:hypothetical protein
MYLCVRTFGAEHGVGLAGARLPEGEDAHLFSYERWGAPVSHKHV